MKQDIATEIKAMGKLHVNDALYEYVNAEQAKILLDSGGNPMQRTSLTTPEYMHKTLRKNYN